MPDEEKVEGEEQEQQAKKGPPMLIIFIAGGMVVLGIVAFVLVKFVFSPAPAEDAAVEEVVAEKTFDIDLFSFEQATIVNLAESNGQRYLKVNLQLEMSSPDLRTELDARKPQLMDLIIAILSSKTLEDVTATVGRNRLKREIIDRINAELVSGKIVNIFFTEFVIQ